MKKIGGKKFDVMFLRDFWRIFQKEIFRCFFFSKTVRAVSGYWISKLNCELQICLNNRIIAFHPDFTPRKDSSSALCSLGGSLPSETVLIRKFENHFPGSSLFYKCPPKTPSSFPDTPWNHLKHLEIQLKTFPIPWWLRLISSIPRLWRTKTP